MEWKIKLTEKEFQDLMFIWLMRNREHTKSEIFREININGSHADIVIFRPYQQGTLYVYECKMYYDNDKKRLDRQIKDYSQVADYIYVLTFGKIIDNLPNHINQIKVGFKDGVLDRYRVDADSWKENPKENIDIERRLRTIQTLNDIWETKLRYGKKIEGVLTRKVERLRKVKVEK